MKKYITMEELHVLAEAIARDWELGQEGPTVALFGWRGLHQRTTRGRWRLWYHTFGSYPGDQAIQ